MQEKRDGWDGEEEGVRCFWGGGCEEINVWTAERRGEDGRCVVGDDAVMDGQ